jgi:hypothetical protein
LEHWLAQELNGIVYEAAAFAAFYFFRGFLQAINTH